MGGATNTGTQNTMVGHWCGYDITDGNYNTAMGASTAGNITSGTYTAAFGRLAAHDLTTGSSNTCFGISSGYTITTGSSNVCLGPHSANGQTTTGSDQLYVARAGNAQGNAAVWIYGNSSGACYQGNNSSAWSTTSDRRLKKNIVDNTKGLAEINQLRVTNFEYRTEDEIDMSEFPLADNAHQVVLGEGNGGHHTGVIAQEIESVLPECIKVSDRGAKTVDTDPILWALVNSVKELSAKNDELVAANTALAARVTALES